MSSPTFQGGLQSYSTNSAQTDINVRTKPYPIPLHFKSHVNDEIQEFLRLCVIEKSDSEYCSPLLMVEQKDKSIRLCTDYRSLNAKTKYDHVPMQDPQALLSHISESTFFSKLDLKVTTSL